MSWCFFTFSHVEWKLPRVETRMVRWWFACHRLRTTTPERRLGRGRNEKYIWRDTIDSPEISSYRHSQESSFGVVFVIQGVVITETFVHVLFNSNLTEENDCYCLEWPLLTGSIINNTCTLSVPFDPLDNKNILHNSYGPSQRPNPHCQHRSQALSSLPPSSLLACGIPSRLIPSLQIFQGTSVPPSSGWLWSRVGGTRNAPSVVYMLNWLIL